MEMAAKLGRGVEIARSKGAESFGNSPSCQGGGKFSSARKQGRDLCLNIRASTTGRCEINGRTRSGRKSYGG